MRELQARYEAASKQYIDQVKLDQDVIGVIISGSLAYSTIDKNSDIDIYVVLDNTCDYRERGNTWIDGIEIEYFKNPPQQIRSYFQKEKSPHTAHMFAHGKLVLCKSEIVKKLITEAKEIVNQAPPKPNTTQIELSKYLIDDQFKDLEDSIKNGNKLGAIIIRHRLIDRCIDIFCQMHQIRREKDKRVHSQIKSVNEDYLKAIEPAQSENWDLTTQLTRLKVETEALLGGKRAKEWKLRSGLDI